MSTSRVVWPTRRLGAWRCHRVGEREQHEEGSSRGGRRCVRDTRDGRYGVRGSLCTNIQKDEHNPANGVEIIINASDGSLEWANAGVIARVNQGLIDPATGAGFHGLVGLDFDGNGTVDAMTYIVGPEGDALPD